MRIDVDTHERRYDKFEVFKLKLGTDYGLYVHTEKEGWIQLQTYTLPHALEEIAKILNEEWDAMMGLLYEWLHDGRFLVSNAPEKDDLVRRTREAIERDWSGKGIGRENSDWRG